MTAIVTVQGYRPIALTAEEITLINQLTTQRQQQLRSSGSSSQWITDALVDDQGGAALNARVQVRPGFYAMPQDYEGWTDTIRQIHHSIPSLNVVATKNYFIFPRKRANPFLVSFILGGATLLLWIVGILSLQTASYDNSAPGFLGFGMILFAIAGIFGTLIALAIGFVVWAARRSAQASAPPYVVQSEPIFL